MNSKDQIYLRFFSFNITLSAFFIFAQKLFENNFFVASFYLWIILMVAMPLGAAVYTSWKDKLKNALPFLFLAAYLWILFGNYVFTRHILFWDIIFLGSFLENLNLFLFLQYAAGAIIFSPLFCLLGMMEVDLYFSLTEKNKDVQWKSYLTGIGGLLFGVGVCHYVLFAPNPFYVGFILLAGLLVYDFFSRGKIEYRLSILTIIILFFSFSYDLYVKDPFFSMERQAEIIKNTDVVKGEELLDEWQPSLRFTLHQRGKLIHGFYNSVYHWSSFPHNNGVHFLPEYQFLPSILSADANIALIGSGGGAQLAPLLSFHPKHIYAVDIIPNLSQRMSALGIKEFMDSRVTARTQDGRQFIEEAQSPFDLIYLPHTESAFQAAQSIFEPAHRLYSLEAMQLYKSQLTPKGILAILKNIGYTESFPFAHNYMASMREAGFFIRAYTDQVSYTLIVGSLTEDVLLTLDQSMKGWSAIPINESLGRVIVDDKPFYASVTYSARSIYFIFFTFISILLLICLLVGVLFQRKRLILAPLCCGMNYTLILLGIQLLLFFQMSRPLEAAIVGNVLFLILIGLGSILYQQRLGIIAAAFGSFSLSLLFGWSGELGLLMILAVLSGSFFPRLLHCFIRQLPMLLILDGLGAAMAAGIYLCAPTLWGLQVLLWITGALFVITGWVVFKAAPLK